jgi:zinc protease
MKKITSIILVLFFTFTLSAQTKVEDTKTFTLKNGMKFIFLEDHSIPNVNFFIFYKVGSRNEYPGITGISHFFEHMMFNGAIKYPLKQFDIVMEANGGSNNAYTSEDVTAYTNFFPGSITELIFDMEADRIANLVFNDKMIESERGVILSEFTTGYENSNYRLLNAQTLAVSFQAHPYKWTVIGYESDIKNWRKSDLLKYFDTYYAPNNAIAVVVGDISLEKVKSLAQKYLETIPSREPPRPVHTTEPEQMGEKRLSVEKDVSSPNILIAYHVPDCKHKDYYTLDILSSILSRGKSSRLYRSLVSDKQLAVRINANMKQALDPTLFTIYAICSANADPSALEKAIYEEIDKIIKDGVTPEELQKAKNNSLVDFYNSLETMSSKANQIGSYEVLYGDYKKMFDAPAEYKKVSADDIKAAAAKYFKKSNRTVGILQKSEK